MRYIYSADNLDDSGIGLKYFSSYKKAVAYVQSHGYTRADYCSEWVSEFSLPPFSETKYPTHTTVRREAVS